MKPFCWCRCCKKSLTTVHFISVCSEPVSSRIWQAVRNVPSISIYLLKTEKYILYILCDMKLETNYVWPFTRARKLKVKMMPWFKSEKSSREFYLYISRGCNDLLLHKIKN